MNRMKLLVKKLCPWLVPLVRSAKGSLSGPEVVERVLSECHSTVIAGPFKGMRYISKSSGSALAPKLLGTYERELHPVIEQMLGARYDAVVDVGCAEGYYAVGLAMRMPAVTVEAYDVAPEARNNLMALAKLNNCAEQIIIGEECGSEQLGRHTGKRNLMICDIEGGERDLLDPATHAALTCFDILVEIHDGQNSTEIRNVLIARFSKTHELLFIDYEGRTAADAKGVKSVLRRQNRLLCVDEGRKYGTRWGWFRARRWL